jgi:hypothetical protein
MLENPGHSNGTDSRSLKIQRIKGEDCQREQICPSLLLKKKKIVGESSEKKKNTVLIWSIPET